MRNLLYLLLLALAVLGCKWTENLGGGTEPRRETNAEKPVASATPAATTESSPSVKTSETPASAPTKKDFVGRYVKTVMGYDNVIELRESGEGALILNEGTSDEARGNFTWKVDFSDAVFTIKKPVVNEKVIDSGEMTVRAQLIEGGKKLQTDYDLMFRAKGKDVFERK